MYYPEELIEEIRNRNDIVEVVSDYVKLKKTGSTHFGLCPFHNEKSPSFSVNGQRQIFHCFGCGEGGNVYSFIMKYENYTFPEAVRFLAERAGMELPKVDISKEERNRADQKAALLEIHKESAKYYFHLLKSEKGQRALTYLHERGLSDETITRFGLGYASNYSNDLYHYLKEKNYTDELLKLSGLFNFTEKAVYDKFQNRVMFPIMDINNKVIGFGGRVMGEGEPKYLNSPETILFDKSRNLYGMNYARISRMNSLLICEGYMDVIALHQAGFSNAVASLGTALTSRQCLLMKRYADQVYLTYDSDGAGVKAALRAIPMLKEAGLFAKVVNMKPYKDPDEFIKKEGADAYKKRIEEAKNSFLFEIDQMASDADMSDPQAKAGFYNDVAKKLLEFEEELERDVYVDAVSETYNIPKESLKKAIQKFAYTYKTKEIKPSYESENSSWQEKNSSRYGVSDKKKKKDDGVVQAQKLLLSWILNEPHLLKKIETVITEDDFVEPIYHKTAVLLFEQIRQDKINPARIMNQFELEEEHREVSALFHSSLKGEVSLMEKEKALNETIIRIKKNSLDYKRANESDVRELQKLIKEQQALKNIHITL